MINAEPPGGLTPVQREILAAIRSHMRDRGRPPSMREVLGKVGLDSTGALSYQYGKLETSGYLRREAGRPRTVEVRLPGEPAFPSEAGKPGQFRSAAVQRPSGHVCQRFLMTFLR